MIYLDKYLSLDKQGLAKYALPKQQVQVRGLRLDSSLDTIKKWKKKIERSIWCVATEIAVPYIHHSSPRATPNFNICYYIGLEIKIGMYTFFSKNIRAALK